MTFLDEAIKSIEELDDAINKCDFKAVKLSAMATKYTNDALNRQEITLDNYIILVNRIGVMTEAILGKCACTKASK